MKITIFVSKTIDKNHIHKDGYYYQLCEFVTGFGFLEYLEKQLKKSNEKRFTKLNLKCPYER